MTGAWQKKCVTSTADRKIVKLYECQKSIRSFVAKATKEQDKAFQIAQKYLNQGLIPLVQLMDVLLKDENAEQQFKLARDSFQLLAYAHRDMSNLR